MKKILRNAVKCLDCGQEIESMFRHHFVTCKCGAISVDGGKDYLKRVGKLDRYEDISIEEEEA